MKIIFFDFDGTISVPNYRNTDGQLVMAFKNGGWKDYVLETTPDTFRDCRPVKPVLRYASECKDQGCLIYVLTAATGPEEVAGKAKFLQQHCPGLFDDLLWVSSPEDKLDRMKEIAATHGLTLSDCALVEDSFATLIYVMHYGVEPIHVSSLVCDL